MNGDEEGQPRMSFPIYLQPGRLPGSWHATSGGTPVLTAEFGSALDLLRWLEGLDPRITPPPSGLR